MKIKVLLGIAGACFGYSLIVLRSFLDAPLESGYHEVQDQHPVTMPIDIAVIMPKLMACMEAFMENKREVINMLLVRARAYVEVYDDPNNKDHIPIDSNLVIDALPSDIVNNLSDAVKLMVDAGFEKECRDVYSSCRWEFLDEVLFERCQRRGRLMLRKTSTELRFGLQKLDVEDVIGDSMFLGHHVKIWVETFHITMRILFPNERRLCERVFSGYTSATDLAFMGVCSGPMIHLLDVANSFAALSSKALLWPKITEVLETIHGLISEFQSLFFELPNDLLRNKAINTCKRLEEATKGIFMDFENWICHSSTKGIFGDSKNRNCHDRAIADFSSWIYPISCHVMKYLGDVSESRILLEKGFQENSLVAHKEGASSSLSSQIVKIMELLDRHLEVKSKNDHHYCYLLMVSNRWFIEQSVKESNELRKILGDDWIQKHHAKVLQSIEDYQRSSWDRVIGVLKLDGNEPITTVSMIENLELFNSELKEICRTQSPWFALDEELRKEIRNCLEKIVWPAYGNFIEQRVKEPNELWKILGDDWIQKHHAKVKQSIEDYRRSSWDRVIGLLKLDGNEATTTVSMIEKNLELFNKEFKEICSTQSPWFVLDEELRKEIRNSLEKIVWQAYGNFLEQSVKEHNKLWATIGSKSTMQKSNKVLKTIGKAHGIGLSAF